MLGVAFLTMLSYVVTVQAVSPVLSLIMAELNLSYTQGGLLVSLFALPGIIVSIPAGILSDRYGQKKIGIISFSLAIAGTAIVAAGGSFPVVIAGRIVAGVGAMTLQVLGPQLLAQWFRGREVGTAMGVFNSGFPLGTILAVNLLAVAGESMGWRASIWLSAAMPAIGLVAYALLFSEAPRSRDEALAPSGGFFQSIKEAGFSVWLVGIAWLLFNAAIFSLVTFTPEFLQTMGYSVSSAGFVSASFMWTALVIGPVYGYMIDKLGYKRLAVIVGGVASAIVIGLIPGSLSWVLGLMLMLGITQTLIPVAIFALPPDITRPERLGLSFGILATCLNLGIFIGPAVTGLVLDTTTSYPLSYAVTAAFVFLVVVPMAALRLTAKTTQASHTVS